MIEGVVRSIEGDPILAVDRGDATPYAFPAADMTVAAERDYRYCTEFIIRGAPLPVSNEVRIAMHQFGGSVGVAVISDILKVHVHTDTPEAVFTYASRWGNLTFRKADDMRAQHRALSHLERRPVALVTDTSADLPDAVLDRHHIALVPLQIVFGGEVHLDRVGMRPEEFYRLLRSARQLPTTSQPSPADFVRVFRSALDEADEVVAVLVGSALSAPSMQPRRPSGPRDSSGSIWWTARRRLCVSDCWRCAEPSWRNRDGGRQTLRGSSHEYANSPVSI